MNPPYPLALHYRKEGEGSGKRQLPSKEDCPPGTVRVIEDIEHVGRIV